VLTTDTDFLALLTKIIAAKPDAVYLALTAEQAANFIIQARQQGIDPKVKFLGVPNMGADQFVIIGGKAVEGSVYVADYFPGMVTAENKRFVEAYRKRYNRMPDNGAALGYTAVKIAASAIKGGRRESDARIDPRRAGEDERFAGDPRPRQVLLRWRSRRPIPGRHHER
jgi:branched-chain amino acid transport system substrate-binding protein